MSRIKIYSLGVLAVLVFFSWFYSGSNEENEQFSEVVKISLREVGNQLLHANQDATSLVLPIIELEKSKYQLSFQQQLSIEPSSLVSIVDNSFQKSSLPIDYRVEVIQCADREVAYSYEMHNKEEKDIIPCAGRILPYNCYTIEVRFTGRTAFLVAKQSLLYIPALLVLFLLGYLFQKRKRVIKTVVSNEKYAAIGSFRFYQEQNKLVKETIEISLSNKECELLAIFIASPNKIIKRDELLKKVWEDNGVFVGRSLDTYVSKLRKKLKEDDTIKLTNIHGVGYKLEISY